MSPDGSGQKFAASHGAGVPPKCLLEKKGDSRSNTQEDVNHCTNSVPDLRNSLRYCAPAEFAWLAWASGLAPVRDMEVADGMTSWHNARVEVSFSFAWFSSSILWTDEIATGLSPKGYSSVGRGRCVPERGGHSGRDYPDGGGQWDF